MLKETFIAFLTRRGQLKFLRKKMSESQTKAGNQGKFEILKFKIAQVYPRDMLNNFCFHLYAQKSLFIAENCNGFFWTSAPPYPLTLEFLELVPS